MTRGERELEGGAATLSAAQAAEAPEPPSSHLVGTTLRGTYRVIEVIDEGGMGTVFSAEHVRLRRQVAVKVLAQHLVRDANALTRFEREAAIVSQLHHPNIVHILDFDTTESGEPYIVMELLVGEALAARLDRDGALPLDDCFAIVTQVAAGLHAAHTKGVVHRDLKPDNVYLLRIGDDAPFVKLLDFGISKAAGAASTRVTREFDVLGTPEYMAPEQALGKTSRVDHRADQFALATIAYECISGVMPFEAETVMAVLQRVINDDPAPLHEVASHCPAALSQVIARALSKEPQARYPSIESFATAFYGAFGDLAPARRSSRAPRRTQPTSSRMGPPDGDSFEPATGVRALPPGRAGRPSPTSPPPTSPPTPEAVSAEVDLVRRAVAFGESRSAAHHAQRALMIATACAEQRATDVIDENATLLEQVFEREIGSLARPARVLKLPEKDSAVTPVQMYLLTHLKDGCTLDELMDVSPLPRLETLRLVDWARNRGIIRLG